MSGPYDNQGYGQQGQYNQYTNPNQYPQQYPQQSNYGDQQQYQQGGYQQQHSGYGAQEFAPPARQDSFGPPQHGGFQQGIQGHSYGQYDASNPQGHSTYYGQPQQGYGTQPTYGGQPQHNDSFAANQAYQQQMAAGGTGAQPGISNHQFAKQSSDPNAPNYDPSAPPMTESDRGLLGALGGGFAGHHFGGKQGHGLLGTIGGALAGSFAEDFLKKKKKHGGSSSNSSWGGSKW